MTERLYLLLDSPLHLLWWLEHRVWRKLLYVPHSTLKGVHSPRWSWVRHIGFPWLWCRCGDGMDTWGELWHRECSSCHMTRLVIAREGPWDVDAPNP